MKGALQPTNTLFPPPPPPLYNNPHAKPNHCTSGHHHLIASIKIHKITNTNMVIKNDSWGHKPSNNTTTFAIDTLMQIKRRNITSQLNNILLDHNLLLLNNNINQTNIQHTLNT